jgi:hypothetical protein
MSLIKFNMTFDLAKCHWLMEKLTALGFLTGNMMISPGSWQGRGSPETPQASRPQ